MSGRAVLFVAGIGIVFVLLFTVSYPPSSTASQRTGLQSSSSTSSADSSSASSSIRWKKNMMMNPYPSVNTNAESTGSSAARPSQHEQADDTNAKETNSMKRSHMSSPSSSADASDHEHNSLSSSSSEHTPVLRTSSSHQSSVKPRLATAAAISADFRQCDFDQSSGNAATDVLSAAYQGPTKEEEKTFRSQLESTPFDPLAKSLRHEFQARQAFCSPFGQKARPDGTIPQLYYGVMFGVEFDMLEVVLHEVYPIVDKIFITESTVTHSTKPKQVHFERLMQSTSRYSRFADKIVHNVFRPTKHFKSGWDIEKRQRQYFLKVIAKHGIKDGDIVMGNIDLDELLTRETLLRMKFCETSEYHFRMIHFRYQLNCLQEAKFSTYFTTTFAWKANEMRSVDLYRRRTHRNNSAFDSSSSSSDRPSGTSVRKALSHFGAWHMTAFGGVKLAVQKSKNSPHTHLSPSATEMEKNIKGCIYQDSQRPTLPPDWWLVVYDEEKKQGGAGGAGVAQPPLSNAMLPDLVAQNVCLFVKRGWLRGPSSSSKG